METVGGAIAGTVATKLAEVAITKGIDKFLGLRTVKPIKEKISARLALAVQLNDIPEKDVNDFLKEYLGQFPAEYGKLPYDMPLIRAGSGAFAMQVSTYGTLDEFDEDEFEKLVSSSMTEQRLVTDVQPPDIVPTISSISVFLYPVELNELEDILHGYQALLRLDQDIRRILDNFGSTKAVIILVTKENVLRLTKAINPMAEKFSLGISEFNDQYGNTGVQVLNATDLGLMEILTVIKKEFGGIINKFMKR